VRLIHRSAWKGNSPKFAYTAFAEVSADSSAVASFLGGGAFRREEPELQKDPQTVGHAPVFH
jgi:hypothetical protein